MRTIYFLIWMAFVFAGCDRQASPDANAPQTFTAEEVAAARVLLEQEVAKSKIKFEALDAARPTAPYIADFIRLFPAAKVSYTYFSETRIPGFNVDVELHGRYPLTMQLPVLFDAELRNVVGYGEPDFLLLEIESRSGRSTRLNSLGQLRFGAAEWKLIVAAGGDFRAIGYEMITDKPVLDSGGDE